MSSTMKDAQKKKPATKRTSKRTADAAKVPMHDDIAQRARELFEESGRQPGRDVEFWLEAERQLREALKD